MTTFPAQLSLGLRRAPAVALGWAVLCTLGTAASAAVVVWDGGGGDNNWGTAANWVGDANPTNDGVDTVQFAGATRLTPNLDVPWSVAGLAFNSGASAFVVGGSGLTLGVGGIVNNAASLQTVSAPLTLAGAQNWNAASGNLTVSGTVDNGGHTLSVTSTTAARVTTLSGVLSGTGGLTKTGASALTLSGNNTYSGTTTLTAGTTTVGHANAFGTGTLALNGGTLAASATRTLPNAVTLTANSTIGGAAALTLAGGVTLTGNRTLTVSNTAATTLSAGLGESGGARNFTKAGTGNLILNAASTYTGTTTITAGTLTLGASGTISDANLVLNGGVLARSGTFDRPLGSGSGAVQFGASGGGFAATGGALSVGFAGTETWGSTAGFLPTGGTLTLSSAAADNTVTWTSDFSLGGATRTIAVNNGTAATDAVISAVVSGTGGLNKSGTGTLGLSGANTFSGQLHVQAGTVTTAALGDAAAASPLGAHGTVKLGSSTNAATLIYTGAGETSDKTFDLGGTTGGATLDASGTGALVLSSGVTASGAGNKTLTLTGTSTAANEIQGTIVNSSGTTGITKSGAGRWELSGANTYSGTTSVTAGTLVAGSNTAFGSGTLSLGGGTVAGDGTSRTLANNITIAANSTLGGASNLGFDGAVTNTGAYTLTFSNTGSTTFAGAVSLSNSGTSRLLTLSAGTGANVVFSGVIANGGTATASSLSKTGAGTLTLSGANTFAGGVSLGAGTLVAGHDSALGTGTLTLAGGTLVGDGSPRTLANARTMSATSTLGGSSALALTGLQTNTGSVTLNVTNSGTTTLGAINLSNSATARTLTINAAGGDVTVSGVIANGGTSTTSALAKTGAGTLILAGANTYGGTTSVPNGTLRLGAASALPNLATTVASTVAGGTALLDLDGYDATVTALTLGGGTGADNASAAHVQTGAGTLTLAGNVTYSATGNPLGSTLSGQLALGAATRTFTVNDSTTAAADLTVSAVVSSTGGGLTKAGTGTLVLAGANTYDAVTTVSAGTLEFSSVANVGGGASSLGAPTTIGTGTLALGGGTLRYTGTGHGTDRVVNLTATSTLDASGTGTLTFDVASGSAVTGTNRSLTLTGTGTGAILDPIATGTGALTKTGTGTWLLAGANTYTGATTVNRGTLRAGANDIIANASAVTVNSTAAGETALLDLDGYSDTVAALTFGGTGATATSTSNVATGAGTLTLAGNVTYSATNHPLGSTLSGQLALGASTRSFTVGDSTNAAIDLAIPAAISSTGGGLTKAGLGTLFLSGANTYTGATTVNTGTLRLGSSSSLPNTALTINSTTAGATALLDLADFNASVTALTFGGTGGTATSTSNLSTGTGVLTLGGAVTFTNTGNPLGSTLSGRLSLGAATRTFTINDSTNAPVDLTVSAAIAATAGGISKAGTGTLLLSGDNEHSGPTIVTAGTLALGHDHAAGTGTLTLSGGTLRGDGGARTIANALSLTASTTIGGTDNLAFTGLLTNSAATTLTVTNAGTTVFGAINLSNSATARTLTVNATGGDVTISGAIANGGTATSGALVKTGTGTLALTGSSTYTGTTSVQNGTLAISSLGHVSGGTSALGAPTSTANGTIALGATTTTGTLRYTGTGHTSNRVANLAGTTGGAALDASGTGALVLTSALTATGAGAKTLTLTGTSTAANTLSGAIVNNSGLNPTAVVKTGTGTWELGGVNTFTGGLTVEAGTLTLKAGAALAATGSITVNGGTLQLDNVTQTATWLAGTGGHVSLVAGHNLILAEFAASEFAGVLEGDGTLLLNSAAGVMTLSGSASNTQFGTTVQAGTLVLAKTGGAEAVSRGSLTVGNGSGSDLLRLDAAHQIGSTVGLTLAGGTFGVNGFSETLGTLTVTGGGTIDFGSGASLLIFAASAAQSWTGTLTIANYTPGSDVLRFGDSASALTVGQLIAIEFTGFPAGAVIDASGNVSPVPEPSTYALFAGLAALALAARRRTRRSPAP